jgi:hypothetical protein
MLRLMPRGKLILLSILCATLWACSPAAPSTPFIPPTNPSLNIEPAADFVPTPTPQEVQIISLATAIPTVDQTNCINNLTFIEDVTVPDNTSFTYGAAIDKQWRVENSGTCNWTSTYRLRQTGGAALGAPEEIALFPARSGTQPIIQITFTAPFENGEYESAWQAFGPNGLAFGDPIYIRILVSQ